MVGELMMESRFDRFPEDNRPRVELREVMIAGKPCHGPQNRTQKKIDARRRPLGLRASVSR
jgi:hypothetical protein